MSKFTSETVWYLTISENCWLSVIVLWLHVCSHLKVILLGHIMPWHSEMAYFTHWTDVTRARPLRSKLTLGVWPWLPVCNLSSLPLPCSTCQPVPQCQRGRDFTSLICPHCSCQTHSHFVGERRGRWRWRERKRKINKWMLETWENRSCIRLELTLILLFYL